MKKLPLLFIPISLMACTTPPTGPYPITGETPPSVSSGYVTSQEGVRLPETVKVYEHNPYQTGKGNLHSSGTIFTVEQSAAWDLRPGATAVQRVVDPTKLQTPTRTQVEEGPLDAAPELPVRNVQMPAQLEQELAKQKQITRVQSEQLDELKKLTVEWRKTQEAAAVIQRENQRLEQEMQALKDAEALRQQKAAQAATEQSKPWYSKWFSKSDKAQVSNEEK